MDAMDVLAYVLAGAFIGALLMGNSDGCEPGWQDGAIGVYEKTIVCEQAMDEWICKKVEKEGS